ncbi:2OG-Fe(II) oxygenase [Magnetococcus marinus MC-1]|uniref:2OG-Fe(II) oxygenase n=1 Tax=Magnetococcus marinus (strain ATCC BAA-1437 / JCM 17883 / MC-1) TaxID=156889 RepID=A0L8V5_MAGMM|nr:2OG-Fe(II) oxygenase [Magnetococcus marinus]ABK44398.1 2OG-Fe(II) oxygenase [Magnetococcus marinus MC-1]
MDVAEETLLEQNLFHEIIESMVQHRPYVCHQQGNLPMLLALHQEVTAQHQGGHLRRAGVGRADGHHINDALRTDLILWLDGTTAAQLAYMAWLERLRLTLNAALQLGLFYVESQFSCYQPGGYYRRHKDAFVGEENRIVTVVTYLNPQWQAHHGGALLIHPSGHGLTLTVQPKLGTMVCFLSEAWPHEVSPTQCDRYAIASWFRRNPGPLL